jgi:hypothetical protein
LVSTQQTPGKYLLSLTDATPGSILVWAWGTQTGQYQIASPELLLNIENPAFFAQSTANNAGQSELVFEVPQGFRNDEIYFQAYESIPTPMTSNLVASNMIPRLVTSIGPAGNPITNAQTVVFDVVFRESVLGVNAEDFLLETERVTGARILSVEGRGSNYKVTVHTGMGDGLIKLILRDESRIADVTGLDPSLSRFGAFEGDSIRVHKTLLDANLDYTISPLDVLAVIDSLNRNGASFAVGPYSPIYTYDVNLDGWVTPLDVLAVIDFLNSNFSKGGEGEEFGPPLPPIGVIESSGILKEPRETKLTDQGVLRIEYFGSEPRILDESKPKIAPSNESDPADIWTSDWDLASVNLDDMLDQMLGKSVSQ